MDKSTFTGIFLALGGILAGLLLEGGKVSQVIQPTAGMIVLGGTIGAVMVQFPSGSYGTGGSPNAEHILESKIDSFQVIRELVDLAHKARRNGIVSLDSEL